MKSQSRRRGFTVIELVVVMSIIAILVSIAVPNFVASIARARESVLRQNLYAMRISIDQFSIDKGRAPESLEDLIDAGYLRVIPKDPITNSTDTWEVVEEDVLLTVNQDAPGISDVRSGASGVGTDGTPYSEW